MTNEQAKALYRCAKEHSIIKDKVVVVFDDVDFVELVEEANGVLVITQHKEIPLTQYEINEFKLLTNKIPCEHIIKIKEADNILHKK